MTPVLFAAALAIAPPAFQPYHALDGSVQLGGSAPTVRTFVVPPKINTCAKFATQTVAPDGVQFFKRLDQLPWGLVEHAVWRTVGGCPVREIVYQGRTWYLAANNPEIERLDPAAHRPLERRYGF